MTRRRNSAVLLAVLDVIAVVVAFNAMAFLRGFALDERMLLEPLIAPILILIIAVYLVEGYRARTDMLSVDYASQHTIAVFGAMIATLLLAYVFLKPPYELQTSRLVIALSFLALIPITLAYRRALYLRAQAARGDRSIVFLGDARAPGCFERSARSRAPRNASSTPWSARNRFRHSSPAAPSRCAPFPKCCATCRRDESKSRRSCCAKAVASSHRRSRGPWSSSISPGCPPIPWSCFTRFTGRRFRSTG
jgi:hypothetical protein